MFGIFIATGVLLFFSCKLGIYDWAHSYRGVLIGRFAVSGAVLLTYIGSGIYPWVADHMIDTRIIYLRKKHLRHLTDDEKEVCGWFVEKNGQSYRSEPVGHPAKLDVQGLSF